MTIREYLQELDELMSAAPEVIKVEIVRRSVWDTDMEIIALYRYKLTMSDGSLLELTERLVEDRGVFSVTKYRHHWQNRHAQLIKRWDNAPHHPEIETFPHHVHDGSETHIVGHEKICGLDVLNIVISEIAREDIDDDITDAT